MTPLTSPNSGRPLTPDGPHALSDGAGERWPVVEGIAYLRAGSETLAAATLARLDAGDRDRALALLLAENDAWWDEQPPSEHALRALVREADGLTLREAMARLGWGRVGDYFAHRWSDPTFVAGLALTDAHWTAPTSALELACGVGHHLRALSQAGVERLVGGDVVFAKLWVARRWVVDPDVTLICFDAEAPWPVRGPFDLAVCHDAFYFLRDKAGVAGRLTATATDVVVSHVHNRAWPSFSSGAAVTADELAALFPHTSVYDDAELTRAGAERRTPQPRPWAELGEVEAFSLASGPAAARAPRPADGPLSRPPAGAPLSRNPLLGGGEIRWPSDRYREEYAARATYGRNGAAPADAVMSPATAHAAATRDLLDLPARW